MNPPRPYQQEALDECLARVNRSESLLPNPRAYHVKVGQVVTCLYSKRPIIVEKVNEHGGVYEWMPGDRLNFIGSYYLEFEPAFVSDDRLQAQLAQLTCQ